jgi:predicted metalloprotease
VRWRSTTLTAAAAVLAVLTAGCLLPGVDSDPGANGAGGPGSGANGAAEPATETGPRPSEGGESLEGRFSHSTMDEYVDAITPMITEWVDDTWRSMPDPGAIRYVPTGRAGDSACLDSNGRTARFTSTAYAYCGADETIYVGQDMLWVFYTRTGDAGPAVGLAHEWGHHIQQQVGVPGPDTAEQSVRLENQADCLAGAWTKYTDERGWLEYPDDIEDIETLFPLIGSAEGPGRDHGTPIERARAFQRGFDGGAAACNDYYPLTPVIVQ